MRTRPHSLPDLLPAELDSLSAVSQADRDEAAAAWRADTEPVAANLLEATEDGDGGF